MKKHQRIGLCLGFLALIGQSALAESLASIHDDIEALPKILEHNQGEALFMEYARKFAKDRSIEVQEQDFSQSKGFHSFSRNIILCVPGKGKDRLALAASLEGPEGSTGQNSFSLSLLLYLASRYAALPIEARPINLEFALLGAEFPAGAPGLRPIQRYGSQLYASRIGSGARSCLIYLSLTKAVSSIELRNYATGGVSPYWLLRRSLDSLTDSGLKANLGRSMYPIYRAGLNEDTTAVAPFLSASIPALELLNGKGSDITELEQAGAKWMEFLLAFTASDGGSLSDRWDRQYLMLSMFGKIVVLREQTFILLTLTIILAVMLSIMLASILARDTFIGLVRGFRRSILSLPLGFALILAILQGSSLLMGFALKLRGDLGDWTIQPATFAVLRLAIIMMASIALSSLAIRFSLMPTGIAFYGAGSMLLLSLDIYLFSAVDLSFSLFFAWTSICCLLSLFVRKRLGSLVFFALILGPLVALFALGSLNSSTKLMAIFLKASLRENLILAFVIHPVVLLFVRLLLVFRNPPRFPRGKALWTIVSLALGASLICLGLVAFMPLKPRGVVRGLQLIERVDPRSRSRSLELDFPGPPVDQALELAGASLIPRRSQNLYSGLPYLDGDTARLKIVKSRFLSRTRVRLVFEIPGDCRGVDLELSSGGGLIVYDANFPFEVDADGRKARLWVGARPGERLEVQMGVPADFACHLTALMYYADARLRLPQGYRLANYLRALSLEADI